MDTGAPSLAHQRRRADDRSHTKLDEWYDRGATSGLAAKKYRKGACENCGAMTHKKQDCVERPRKRGAKFSNKDIRADEVIQNFEGDYDAKRDRWNGYDPASYKTIVDEYEATEAARQRVREEEIDKQTSTDMAAVKKVAKAKKDDDEDFGSSDEDDQDEDKYAEAADQVGQKLDTKTRITVRNLRIREDTAKYLINLDEDSAYYDPKTRSMRDAPEVGVAPDDVSLISTPVDLLPTDSALDEIRRRQLHTVHRRRDEHAETSTVRLAIRSEREQRTYHWEPYCWRVTAPGIPAEEGGS